MLNKCQFIGRLGKDPEVKNLENGNQVANFSIACSEKYKDKATGDTKEKTEWVNVVCWGTTAGVAGKYLHKGDKVYIEGKMSTRSWEKDNVTRYTTEIVVFNLIMLNDKKDDNTSSGSGSGVQKQYEDRGKAQTTYTAPRGNDATDDLPF